jgi:AraC-like DNA-binding protein
LSLQGRELSVGQGDLVLLPRGDEHCVTDRPGSRITRLERLIETHPLEDGLRLRYGGKGDQTRLLCGAFAIREDGPQGVLSLLPDVVRVDGNSSAATTWLSPVLTALQGEAGRGKLGATAVQDKIAEVFVTQVLRSWLLAGEQTGVFPSALLSQDQPIASAVSMIRSDIAREWTIDDLASSVALSRSAFVARFRRAVGESPMRYVARLRMSRAAALLVTSQCSLREIASETGYGNEASLSKAFKRELGHAPGAYRAAVRVPEPTIC